MFLKGPKERVFTFCGCSGFWREFDLWSSKDPALFTSIQRSGIKATKIVSLEPPSKLQLYEAIQAYNKDLQINLITNGSSGRILLKSVTKWLLPLKHHYMAKLCPWWKMKRSHPLTEWVDVAILWSHLTKSANKTLFFNTGMWNCPLNLSKSFQEQKKKMWNCLSLSNI